MAMDLRSLKHFVIITESGGFAEASRKLHVSQPTLSRSIAQLEEKIGAKLFSRGVRGTIVTEDGKRLLPHALSILAEVRRAQALFDDAEDRLEQVTIETSPNFLHMGLPEALKAVLDTQPDIATVVHTATMETALANVRSRKSDIALCLVATHSHHPREMEDLLFENLGTELLVPVARHDHPAFREAQSLETLSRYEWAIPFQLSVSYRFETLFFRRNMAVPPQRLNCTSITLLQHAVTECGLIGLMPRSLIARQIEQGKLRQFDINELYFDYLVLMASVRLATGDRRALRLRPVLDTVRTAVSRAMAPDKTGRKHAGNE